MSGVHQADLMGKSGAKAELRKALLAHRNGLESCWVAEHSGLISANFMALPEFGRADVVALYMGIKGEVDLSAVLEWCLANGKQIVVPGWRAVTRDYGFVKVGDDTEFKAGNWGVLEPVGAVAAELAGLTVCIAVPGVGFDDQGGRLGFGGGYYDRLLAEVCYRAACIKVGIGFDFQLVAEVPGESWDIGMDIILSETRVVRVGNGK
jgi:5-formyltetrahydrofolate cyclo-ligase